MENYIELTELEKEVYNDAIRLWGREAQLDMLIEEMAELMMATLHLKRERTGLPEVSEEIADVIVMVRQVSWMLHRWVDLKQKDGEMKSTGGFLPYLNHKVEKKLRRLGDRVAQAQFDFDEATGKGCPTS